MSSWHHVKSLSWISILFWGLSQWNNMCIRLKHCKIQSRSPFLVISTGQPTMPISEVEFPSNWRQNFVMGFHVRMWLLLGCDMHQLNENDLMFLMDSPSRDGSSKSTIDGSKIVGKCPKKGGRYISISCYKHAASHLRVTRLIIHCQYW